MSRIARLLDAALEDLHRVETVLTDRLASMREASTAWPTASGGGGPSRGALVHWCWRHEQDVAACHADGGSCDGEPLAVSDPTGESALTSDRGRSDHQLVERKVKAIRKMADELVGVLARYEVRTATVRERRETLAAFERNERAEECWSCARSTDASGNPRFSPGERRVVIAGDRQTLCRWCLDWLRNVGELPNPRQIDEHHRGLRVRRPQVAS